MPHGLHKYTTIANRSLNAQVPQSCVSSVGCVRTLLTHWTSGAMFIKNRLILWSLVTSLHIIMLAHHVIDLNAPLWPIFLENMMLQFISMNVPVAGDLTIVL